MPCFFELVLGFSNFFTVLTSPGTNIEHIKKKIYSFCSFLKFQRSAIEQNRAYPFIWPLNKHAGVVPGISLQPIKPGLFHQAIGIYLYIIIAMLIKRTAGCICGFIKACFVF